MSELRQRIEALRAEGSLVLPLPGGGQTAERHRTLAQWGREDLSLARIAEAHTDAMAILCEAGIEPASGKIFGVWASDGPQSPLIAAREGREWRIDGTKQYCSGSSIIDAALVTAHAADGLMLFEVRLGAPGISLCGAGWSHPLLIDTATQPVTFGNVRPGAAAAVGGPGWYLSRPGFWQGAIGPAACWAGGALSLIDAASRVRRHNPHARAHIGALQSIAWGLDALLVQAGQAIDADPQDERGEARPRALKVRHLIERWCTEALDRFGRATGPHILAVDPVVARQHAALSLYIRQCHAERDLETIPSAAGV